MGVPPKGLYKFNKEIFRSIYARRSEFIWFKTSYAGWNIDEKLDSINAELIVIGIEHGNDKRMDELTPFKMINMVDNADAYLEFIVIKTANWPVQN
jgi:alpha-glucosidase